MIIFALYLKFTRKVVLTTLTRPPTLEKTDFFPLRVFGCDPFNRNFRKFRSKLNASVRSKIFEKVGLPFVVNHFSRLDWSERKLAVSFDHSIPVPRYSVFSTCYLEKSTYHCSFWIANSGSIGVTLIFHLCAVATGQYLIPKPIVTFDCLKANYFPRESGMFFSSVGSRV